MLLLFFVYRFILKYSQLKHLKILVKKLPKENLLLLTAIKNIQKQGNSTTKKVIDEYQKLSETQTSQSWVTAKLEENSKIGLITKKISNQNDTPKIIWNNNVTYSDDSLFSKIRQVFKNW